MAIEGAVRVFLSPSLLCARFLVRALLVQSLLGAVLVLVMFPVFISLCVVFLGGVGLYTKPGRSF